MRVRDQSGILYTLDEGGQPNVPPESKRRNRSWKKLKRIFEESPDLSIKMAVSLVNIRQLFRSISKGLQADFEKTIQITHRGMKGESREDILRHFLIQEKRLPERFGIGSGEIITNIDEVSRQCDLIIYDKIDGISLISQDSVNVFPIESVAGIIEVKSVLDKNSLFDSLENIKSIKKIAPNSASENKFGGFTIATTREKPFGLIFSYSTSISLDTIANHYKEWASKNDKIFYPNMIAVLNLGIVRHLDRKLRECIYNDEIKNSAQISHISYEGDSLFHFYNAILDLCSIFKAGNFNLTNYFKGYKKSGKHVVRKHEGFGRIDNAAIAYKLKDSFIEEIYKWCQNNGSIKHYDLLKKSLGSLPIGMKEEDLNFDVYLYNPDNLPGLKDIQMQKDQNLIDILRNTHTITNWWYIEIDYYAYYIPCYYMTFDKLEEIPGTKPEDFR